MPLITSISGIRGTVGGLPGDGLTPADIVRFTSAYAQWVRSVYPGKGRPAVVVGRDARPSGEMVSALVTGTLTGMGIDVIAAGLSTTPTVAVAVPSLKAAGGIVITASHNPEQWNALKLLNRRGEFVSAAEGAAIIEAASGSGAACAGHDALGRTMQKDILGDHIRQILAMDLVDADAIARRKFRVAIDCVNSSGGIAVPALLEALGVTGIVRLHCDTGRGFPHNPEPLPEHLGDLSAAVRKENADLGIAVDPDVDRLAFISEDGAAFGEEYTLVAVADYVLQSGPGNTVSNLSSTRALRDVTERAGGKYFASAVGEVNVVAKMKETKAVIGGEGNGGVICPSLHYGRDALAGIALFLSYLAKRGVTCSALRATYPGYHISKNKMALHAGIDVDGILDGLAARYGDRPVNREDGVKIEFGKEWVHLRKSNTEPIIRIYSEGACRAEADALAARIVNDIKNMV